MARVYHFDLSAEDPERAMSFYRKVFGWTFHKWEGPRDYWMISTGEGEVGIDGGLSPKSEISPQLYFTVEVSPIDDYITEVKANGGKVLQEKMAIPGVGWFAMVRDTEGIVFGLMEDDESAK